MMDAGERAALDRWLTREPYEPDPAGCPQCGDSNIMEFRGVVKFRDGRCMGTINEGGEADWEPECVTNGAKDTDYGAHDAHDFHGAYNGVTETWCCYGCSHTWTVEVW